MAVYNKNGWLDTAMHQVKFKPFRKALREELEGHIDDKCEDLVNAGLPFSDAIKKAVVSMGDPTEVGEALNTVHRPMLGRLWILARTVVICLFIAVLFCLFDGDTSPWKKYPLFSGHPELSAFTEGEVEPMLCGTDSVKVSGWTVSVEEAAIISGAENTTVSAIVKVSSMPWSGVPLFVGNTELSANGSVLDSDICLLDSKGNTYSGDIFTANLLNEHRTWNSWYFRIDAPLAGNCRYIRLYSPFNDSLSFTLSRKEAAS